MNRISSRVSSLLVARPVRGSPVQLSWAGYGDTVGILERGAPAPTSPPVECPLPVVPGLEAAAPKKRTTRSKRGIRGNINRPDKNTSSLTACLACGRPIRRHHLCVCGGNARVNNRQPSVV
mmetsp:Transcript_5334/g.17192  ORF Transcript_5334/g.17192 Transcript_5334/m.17192 type:complete len:121 (+) Transcript_5334:79-441(+)